MRRLFSVRKLLFVTFALVVALIFQGVIRYPRNLKKNTFIHWISQLQNSVATSWADNTELITEKKLVLIYTPLFGRTPWPGLETSSVNFTHFERQQCEVQNCEITYDKSRLAQSDAVLFHGRDLPDAEIMGRIPRNTRQRWVYFTHENPVFTYHNLTMYNNFFNWTMSYRRDSDFFVPYNYYRRLEPEEATKLAEPRNYAEGKDKFIAWMVGNCGQFRDDVVQRLSFYVNVTVFGACAKKFNQTTNHCSRGSRDCDRLLRRFKFYLSFENAMCTDYVTEKYWFTPLHHDIIPVVLGGSNYDSKVAIPGSYINVLDFPSMKALADYLEYLNANDTAYNEYFQWKTKYKIAYPLSVLWTCNMCAALNNPNLPDKVYKKLDAFWGVENSCREHEAKIYKLLQNN